MRRIVIWICIGIAAAGLLGFAALVVAMRIAPDATISRLPLITTMWLRTMTTDVGRGLIRERLRQKESAPLVVTYLSGSSGAQWQMLDAISGDATFGSSWGATNEVHELLLALCTHVEARVRSAARRNFSADDQGRMWSKRHYDHFGSGQIRPGPGAWIPDRVAVLAFITLSFQVAGYDHRMPSKYKTTVRALVDQLLAAQDERGCFAADDRDHAIVTFAIAEAHALSNDPRLKAPILKALEWLLRENGGSAETRWSANTDLAVWDLIALKSVAAGDFPDHLKRSKQWMAGNHNLGTQCMENGQVLDATPTDALAQLSVMHAFVGNTTALNSIAEGNLIPQPGLSDVTNYWLTLALMLHTGRYFHVHIAPYLRHIASEQQWDISDPNMGCLNLVGDPAGHALRLLLTGITYRYLPVSPSPVPVKP